MELTKEQLALGDVLLAELCLVHDLGAACAGDIVDGYKHKERELVGQLNRVYGTEQVTKDNNFK